jgi:hypothetical protein
MHFFYLIVSESLESRSGLAGWFWLRISHKVAWSFWLDWQSLKGWLGVDNLFLSLLTWLLAGGPSSSPCGPLHGATDVIAAGFPQNEWFKRACTQDEAVFFSTCFQMKHTIISAVCVWSHRSTLLHRGKGLSQCEYQEVGFILGRRGGCVPHPFIYHSSSLYNFRHCFVTRWFIGSLLSHNFYWCTYVFKDILTSFLFVLG